VSIPNAVDPEHALIPQEDSKADVATERAFMLSDLGNDEVSADVSGLYDIIDRVYA
jgi:hypothetical protein